MKRWVPAILWATITFTVPDEEIKIIENDVVSASEWLKEAWAGKVSKSRERIISQEIQTSLNEGTAIPDTKSEIIDKYMDRPEYKSRAVREAEAEAVTKEIQR